MQIATRGSGGDIGIDSNQGVAVAALIEQCEVKMQRGTPVAFGYHSRAGGKHLHQRGAQQTPEPGCVAVWGIQEDEIVLTPGLKCLPEERGYGLATELSVDPKRAQVAPDRLGRCVG